MSEFESATWFVFMKFLKLSKENPGTDIRKFPTFIWEGMACFVLISDSEFF